MAEPKTVGGAFLRFVAPVVETLRELGNSGRPSEVTDRVIDRLKLSDEEQEETTSNGQSRVRNQIAWARFYLVKTGHIDKSQHGVWTLTEKGRTAKLDPASVKAIVDAVQGRAPREQKGTELDDAALGAAIGVAAIGAEDREVVPGDPKHPTAGCL